MSALTLLPDAQAAGRVAALLALVPDQVSEIYGWQGHFEAELSAPTARGRVDRLKALADRLGKPFGQVKKLFYSYAEKGVEGLIDKRANPELWDSSAPRGMSLADQELVKLWCEKNQRKNEPAIRAMREAWLTQRISPAWEGRGLSVPQTETPLDPVQGYPRGWTVRNLLRYAPDPYTLAASRQGRSAAKSHVPLVYTTRAGLYVGQYYLWDDMWHDHEVVDLDQKKRGRPLEFHGLDLKSAAKFVWGNRTRVETETKHEGLKAIDFRMVLAAGLFGTGYHAERGTTLIVENATASISDALEGLLWDNSGGMIKVQRGGMEGAAAHAGQYAGRAKGNFRFKAALESLGNLIHNELAMLPAQVGKDRDHCPEEMHDGGRLVSVEGKPLKSYGRNKYTDALLAAFSQLPPERAQWLMWDRCTIQQFRMICDEVYGRINRRTEHSLEGWDELYVPSPLGGMRRLSPHEVFQAGRRQLRPISLELVALILGHEGGTPRTVIGNKIAVHDGGVSGDELRFDATGILRDREKYLTVLNPFDPTRLFCWEACGKGHRFVGAIPRLHSVERGEVEAIERAMGEAARRESLLLQPLRRRHAQEAREKAARHAHNAEVLTRGEAATPAERAEAMADPRVVRFSDMIPEGED